MTGSRLLIARAGNSNLREAVPRLVRQPGLNRHLPRPNVAGANQTTSVESRGVLLRRRRCFDRNCLQGSARRPRLRHHAFPQRRRGGGTCTRISPAPSVRIDQIRMTQADGGALFIELRRTSAL
jgi:hypothetical protein